MTTTTLEFVCKLEAESASDEHHYEICFSEAQPTVNQQLVEDTISIEVYRDGNLLASSNEPKITIKRIGEVLGGSSY